MKKTFCLLVLKLILIINIIDLQIARGEEVREEEEKKSTSNNSYMQMA